MLVILPTSLGSPDYTLPDATINSGDIITVRAGSATTIRAQRNQLIDGASTITIPAEGVTSFQSQNGAWQVISTYDPNSSASGAILNPGTLAGRRDTPPVAGVYEEITLGTNLSMTAGVLNAASGSATTATTIERNLGSTPITQGSFTITDAAITSSSKIIIWQAPGPYTGKGTRADEAEMDEFPKLTAYPGSGTATVRWSSKIGVIPALRQTGGNKVRSSLSALAPPQEAVKFLGARVLGKVKGNVKFSYVVL